MPVLIALFTVSVAQPADAFSFYSKNAATAEGSTASDTETGERTDTVNFKGQLRELSASVVPTIIIVRVGEVDKTVEVIKTTKLKPAMDNWLAGDQVQVAGKQNANTSIVTAGKITNLSIRKEHIGVNGWVESVDAQANILKMKDARGKAITMRVPTSTKIVVGGKNPATLADLQPKDKIRARAVRVRGSLEARMIVAVQRGKNVFMKARNFAFSGTLKGILNEATVVPAILEVAVNNKSDGKSASGAPVSDGSLVRVAVSSDTILVRRFDGRAQFEELQVGDELKIVGWLNDDNVIQARLIKDVSVWQTDGVAGTITGIYLNPAYMVIQHGKNEIKVYVDAKTEFWNGNKKIGFEEIAVRDSVRVRGGKMEGTDGISAKKVLVVPVLRDANVSFNNMGGIVVE